MKLIKPHNDKFRYKHEMKFNGNDYYIETTYGNEEYGYYKLLRIDHHCKLVCYIKMFFWRRAQWRELNEDVKRKLRAIQPPITIVE